MFIFSASFNEYIQSMIYSIENEPEIGFICKILLFTPLVLLMINFIMLFKRIFKVRSLHSKFIKCIDFSQNIKISYFDKTKNFSCAYNDVDSARISFRCTLGSVANAVVKPIFRDMTILLIIKGEEYEIDGDIYNSKSKIHKIFRYLRRIKNFKYKLTGSQSNILKEEYKPVFDMYLKEDCPFEILSQKKFKKYIKSSVILFILGILFCFGMSFLLLGNPLAWLRSFNDGSWGFYTIGIIPLIISFILLARIILYLYLVHWHKITDILTLKLF